MKILILATHFNTGGITRYILTLVKGLQREGHRVFVATSGGARREELLSLGPGITHVKLDIRTKSELDPRIYWALGELKDLVNKEKIDLIHAQTRVTQVMGTLLSRMTKKPLVTTAHGFFKPRLFRKIFPAWGQAVIAISQPVIDHLRQDFKVPEENIRLIPNGVALEDFVPAGDYVRRVRRHQFGLDHGPVIGTVARLSDVKGLDVLIRAMPAVVKKIPNARLIIAGQGREEGALKNLAAELLLQEQVLFYTREASSAELLSLFDVFVMPSRQEGLGLAVLEAQAAELPVVASKVGGLASLIDDGRTGLLVPPEQSEALAQAIVLLLKNPAQAKQMGTAAREFIAEHYSDKKMAEATLKVYERLVDFHEKNSRR